MLGTIGVSAVSYLNTVPFIYGLRQFPICNSINLQLNYPSKSALSLEKNESQVGLIPVAAIGGISNSHIFSNYCIGSTDAVRTVVLFSNSPIDDIKTIHLDHESRTSVLLIKILAASHWNKTFTWSELSTYNSPEYQKPQVGIVAIGDKVFELEKLYAFKYDLALEWKKLTGLPFAFAAWVAKNSIESKFLTQFEKALQIGIENIPLALEGYTHNGLSTQEAIFYLTNNISYHFDDKKREAMTLFLKMGKGLAPG